MGICREVCKAERTIRTSISRRHDKCGMQARKIKSRSYGYQSVALGCVFLRINTPLDWLWITRKLTRSPCKSFLTKQNWSDLQRPDLQARPSSPYQLSFFLPERNTRSEEVWNFATLSVAVLQIGVLSFWCILMYFDVFWCILSVQYIFLCLLLWLLLLLLLLHSVAFLCWKWYHPTGHRP